MIRPHWIAACVIPFLIGWTLCPAPATAHAILVQSSPAAGSSVPTGKLDMSFRFNSRIDRPRSRLTLTLPDHSQTVLAIRSGGTPDVINTSAQLTMPGDYVVRWQVLAIDGHITRGDVAFTAVAH